MHGYTRLRLALCASYAALVICSLHVGGAIYEHVVIDAAWSYNPMVIASRWGGVDRSLFWVPLGVCCGAVLSFALAAGWGERQARDRAFFAGAFYAGAWIWRLACWLPIRRVLEGPADVRLVEVEAVRYWLMVSSVSVVLVIVAAVLLLRAAHGLERVLDIPEPVDVVSSPSTESSVPRSLSP